MPTPRLSLFVAGIFLCILGCGQRHRSAVEGAGARDAHEAAPPPEKTSTVPQPAPSTTSDPSKSQTKASDPLPQHPSFDAAAYSTYLNSLPQVAPALGGWSGSGGSGILCKNGDNQISRIEVLDYYEAETERNIHPALGGSDLEPVAKVRTVITLLQRLDPYKAAAYTQVLDGFMDNAQFIPNVDLTPVDDTGNLFVPAGCRLVQLAVQRVPPFPGDKRYIINQDLWKAMDNDQKAGLILHEIIYWEAITRGQHDSKNARYFNSMISSGALSAMAQGDYTALVRRVGLASNAWGKNFIFEQLDDAAAALAACAKLGGDLDYTIPLFPSSQDENRYSSLVHDLAESNGWLWLSGVESSCTVGATLTQVFGVATVGGGSATEDHCDKALQSEKHAFLCALPEIQ